MVERNQEKGLKKNKSKKKVKENDSNVWADEEFDVLLDY